MLHEQGSCGSHMTCPSVEQCDLSSCCSGSLPDPSLLFCTNCSSSFKLKLCVIQSDLTNMCVEHNQEPLGRGDEKKMSITKIGAWGSGGGQPWKFLPPGGGITKIIIRSAGSVDAVSFVGRDGTGKLTFSGNFGGRGGTAREITLEWPDEYLTVISGTIGEYRGFRVVRSLEFTTNHGRKLGRFGTAEGSKFNLSLEGSAIVGFHGRKGSLLDAIGIFITPVSCVVSKV